MTKQIKIINLKRLDFCVQYVPMGTINNYFLGNKLALELDWIIIILIPKLLI